MAIVHPLAFLLRRVLYSIVIVFMGQSEISMLLGIFILMFTCVFMIAMILIEAQWEDQMLNLQHLFNEIWFYVLCCFLVCFCGLITDVDANIMLGYIMITWLSTLIFFNISVITCDLIIFIRLLILRYRVQTRNIMIPVSYTHLTLPTICSV